MHLQGHVSLRNADTNALMSWTGTEFTTMDNFCMSCHDADGAKGVDTTLNVQASPSNPFGDGITNTYDGVARGAVVNVFSQFSTGNYSHHAVRAPKYTARTTADAISAGKMTTGQNTLYSYGLFTNYTPLGASQSLADNSQLHCGDCHTVGQVNYGATPAAVAIGAHGSNNQYMLRNSASTDVLHTSSTYVCFLCHNQKGPAAAGSPSAGQTINGYTNPNNITNWYSGGSHIQGINGSCYADSTTKSGSTTATGQRLSSSGNITGISCTNCHNTGRTGFGGIHGGKITYSAGFSYASGAYPAAANSQTNENSNRFMGGMGNFGYRPANGAWNYDGTTDGTQYASTAIVQSPNTTGGCYTNQVNTDNAGWSGCNHHMNSGTATAPANQGGARRRASLGSVGRPLDY
jgi:hypothetical protein